MVRIGVLFARRLSSVSGLYAYLVARGDTPARVNPVPRGLMTRRQGGTVRSRMARLVRVPHRAEDVVCGGGGPAGRRAAHAPGPGDGLGHAAGRAAPPRGPGPAVCGCARSLTGGWSWWRARAAITGWSRPRTGSSRLSAPTRSPSAEIRASAAARAAPAAANCASLASMTSRRRVLAARSAASGAGYSSPAGSGDRSARSHHDQGIWTVVKPTRWAEYGEDHYAPGCSSHATASQRRG